MNFYNPYYMPYMYTKGGLFSNLFKGINFSSILNGASKTLINGVGNCCDQANLIVALCRESGIPVRYSHGQHCYFYVSQNYYGHVWAQILVGDTWYAADPTGPNNSLGVIKNWNIQTFNSLRQYALLPF